MNILSCCGCSCGRCSHVGGHYDHTSECKDRFYAEQDGLLAESPSDKNPNTHCYYCGEEYPVLMPNSEHRRCGKAYYRGAEAERSKHYRGER